MPLAVPLDPDAASWARQAGAAAIDLALMGAAGGLIAVAAEIATANGRAEALARWVGRVAEHEAWSHPSFTGALGSLQLTERNWRSPGMRAVGVRRADARTHGPVSVRSAFTGLVLQTANTRVSKVLGEPALARAQARRLAADDEIERMRASRPDADPEELWRDAIAIRRRLGASSCTWMLPRMIVRIAVEQLPALRSGGRQTLTQWLTRTAVVHDR